MKIAVFYHCLFYHGAPTELRMQACRIVALQMRALADSGLMQRADLIRVGINGPVEQSREMAALFLPDKAERIFHGPNSFAENLTIVDLETWAKSNRDWFVLYFHSKGATHDGVSDYARFSATWREGMMLDLVTNWRVCVADLAAGAEVACSHFMRHMADGTQNIAAGNFFWAKASFLAELPSIFLRDRIKQSGIASAESRYEAEVWIGNGRMPVVKEYRPNGGGGVP